MAEVEIFKITVDKEEASKELAKVRRELAEATKTRNDLNKKIKEGTQLTKAEIRELGVSEKQIAKNRAAQAQLVKQITSENNSLQQLRNELAKLTRQRNNQETATESGRKSFERLNKTIKKYSDEIKEAEQAGGDFRRSVGNYQTALKGFPGVAKKVSTGFSAVGTAMKAIPFLLVIDLIKKFIDLMSANAEVAEFLEDALAAVNNVVGVLIENWVAFVKLYVQVITGQKSLSEAFKEGAERAANLGNALEKAATQGYEASAALRDIARAEALLEIETNRTQRAIEEQLTTIANQTATLEERKKAGQEASRLINAQIDKEIELEQKRLTATKLANEATANKVENDNAEAAILAKIEDLEAKKISRNKEIVGQVSGIEKQVRAEQLKTLNERTKAELELQIFRNEILAEEATKETERADLLIQIEKDRLAIQLQDNMMNASQRLLIEEQTARQIVLIRREQFENEIEAQKAFNEALKELRTENNESIAESIELQQERANNAFQNEMRLKISAINADSEITAKRKAEADTRAKVAETQAQTEIQAVATVVSTAGALLSEGTVAFKIAKSIEATISTFTAINKTLAEPSLPFPSNVITAGLIGAQGALNIASINAAAGGGEFMTTKPTLLMVGDNPTGTERITVEPINSMGKTSVTPGGGLVKMAGGGTLVTGSSDTGSIQANAGGASFDMGAFAEAIKGVQLSVGVKEINKVQRRVTAKEQIGKIR